VEAAPTAPPSTPSTTRPVAALAFEGAPAEALPGGRAAAPRVLDAGLALLAADAFGAAWRMLELTRDYVSTRRQFGQPLAAFQAVKHQLANLVTDTEPCRGLWWFAAHAFDHRPRRWAAALARPRDRRRDGRRTPPSSSPGIGF
jgi:alkylation response protein AidB-like acyl-CoA dehydrogenase